MCCLVAKDFNNNRTGKSAGLDNRVVDGFQESSSSEIVGLRVE